MKSILIPGVTILLIIYFIMFFVDNRFWSEYSSLKIRNIVFICLAIYLSYNLVSIYLLKKEKEETALVYKVATVGKIIYTKTSDYIRPFRKELLIWSAAAVGIIFVSLILVGMPGALFLEIPARLGFGRIEGDNLWPAAILLSILWPLLLPVGVLVKYYLIGRGYSAYALTGWIGTVIAGILFLIIIIYWLFRKRTA